MFCTRCGTKLDAGAEVCPNCSASIQSQKVAVNQVDASAVATSGAAPPSTAQSAPAPETTAVSAQPVAPPPVYAPMPKQKKPIPKKLLMGIGAAVAVIAIAVAVLLVIILQPKKFNIEDYVTIHIDGYDGYATARAVLDKDTLLLDIIKAKEKNNKIDFSLISNFEKADVFLDHIYDIDLDVSPSKNLKNGDIVTVEIEYNNEKLKEHKIKFTGKKVEETVANLAKARAVNAFDDLEVRFTGISPMGHLEMEYKGNLDFIRRGSFEADKSSGLKNGDTITVSLKSNVNTGDSGYVLTELKKQYTVSGLDELVTSIDMLGSDYLEELKTQAKDKVIAYTAGSYPKEASLSNLEYVGYAFLSPNHDDKNAAGYGSNRMFIVYSGDVSHSKGEFRTRKIYFPVYFNKVVKNESGLSFDKKVEIAGNTSLGNWYSTDGYINPLLAYRDLVEALDYYKVDAGDGFEKFAKQTQIAKLDDVDSQVREYLHSVAFDKVQAYIATFDNYEATDLTWVGDYLLVRKDHDSEVVADNTFVVVHSVQHKKKDSDEEAKTLYLPVRFHGIVLLPDNKYYVDQIDKDIFGSMDLDSWGWNSVKGYYDGVVMFREVVQSYQDNYTYEMTEGLKPFESGE